MIACGPQAAQVRSELEALVPLIPSTRLLTVNQLPAAADGPEWQVVTDAVDLLLRDLADPGDAACVQRFDLVLALDGEFSEDELDAFLAGFLVRSHWPVRIVVFVADAAQFWPWQPGGDETTRLHPELLAQIERIPLRANSDRLESCSTLVLGAGTVLGPLPRDSNSVLLARALHMASSPETLDWIVHRLNLPVCADDLFHDQQHQVALLGLACRQPPREKWDRLVQLAWGAQLARAYTEGDERPPQFEIEFAAAQRGLHSDARASLIQCFCREARAVPHFAEGSLQARCAALLGSLKRRAEISKHWYQRAEERLQPVFANYVARLRELGEQLALGGGIPTCREILERQAVQLRWLRECCVQQRRGAQTRSCTLAARLDEHLTPASPPLATDFSWFYPLGRYRLGQWFRCTRHTVWQMLECDAEISVCDVYINSIDCIAAELRHARDGLDHVVAELKAAGSLLQTALHSGLRPSLPADPAWITSEALTERVREALGPIRPGQSLFDKAGGYAWNSLPADVVVRALEHATARQLDAVPQRLECLIRALSDDITGLDPALPANLARRSVPVVGALDDVVPLYQAPWAMPSAAADGCCAWLSLVPIVRPEAE